MTKLGTNNQTNREQWLKKTLAAIPAGSKILDAGAGELAYKKFCTHLNYISQDIAEYNGIGNREGFQTRKWDGTKVDIVSDITAIPVKNGEMDAVMCVEVLEHISEPAKAIKEFSRIIKPGGILIITAPFCSLTHFAPHYYANGFSKYWYEKILPEHGFEIREMDFNGNYFEYLAQEVHRLKGVASRYFKISFADKLKLKILKPAILSLLANFNSKDKGSKEILCFGINVLARKIYRKA